MPKVEFDALPDPSDPTMITFKPGNAWTGLTLAVGMHCPDALPIPASAYDVTTRIGNFSWTGDSVEFTPVPIAPDQQLKAPIVDLVNELVECAEEELPCYMMEAKALILRAKDEIIRLRKKCGEEKANEPPLLDER